MSGCMKVSQNGTLMRRCVLDSANHFRANLRAKRLDRQPRKMLDSQVPIWHDVR